MAVIKVPKTPKKAFNPLRRPSALLLKQIEHLEWAVLPASQRTTDQLPKQRVKTEGQAAERIGQLTTMLSASTSRPLARADASGAGMAAPGTLPPISPLPKQLPP